MASWDPAHASSYPNRPIFLTGLDDDLTESEGSGRWTEEETVALRSERAPLSPVSEAQDEYMDDDDDDNGIMMNILASGAPEPPDGGWGWVIVFASFMCNLIVDGIAYSFGVFLPKFTDSFNETRGNVSWAGSLLCGVYLLVGPGVGALTNKFGCRTVCIAGSVVASVGFALSALSPNLLVLKLTYGIVGGIGFGLIYLPAVVCVGYYFERRRALATGIAVCGSGVGTFVFAPLSNWLLEVFGGWKEPNLVFSGLLLLCGGFGFLMRPLEVTTEVMDPDEADYEAERGTRSRPLLQRMADDKKNYLEKGSIAGSAYFMVQLPDGTMERRLKIPLNVDPGVHSTFNLDQLVPGTPLTPVPTMATLPPITEGKPADGVLTDLTPESETKEDLIISESINEDSPIPSSIPDPIQEEASLAPEGTDDSNLSTSVTSQARRSLRERRNSEGVTPSPPTAGFRTADGHIRSPSKPITVRSGSVAVPVGTRSSIPRNGSAPQFNSGRGLPQNGSVPLFDRMVRKQSYKAVPLGSTTNKGSKTTLVETRRGSTPNPTPTHLQKNSSFIGSNSKTNTSSGIPEEDASSMWSRQDMTEGLIFTSSQSRRDTEPRTIIRPMSRKDIFYSGSIVHLPEFQSQKSLTSYRQSVLNLPKTVGYDHRDGVLIETPKMQPSPLCPCLKSSGACKTAFAQMMDISLIKNPVFLFIAVSNIFGMLGYYVPFVYIVDCAIEKGILPEKATFLLSIIGITNTIGRVLSGIISDLPQVNSLFLNNVCILMSGLIICLVPLCPNYIALVAVCVFFGLFVAGYVSLTSIILVDLLGLENLTNAFGLLILFRGAASIVGAPLAGAMYDSFQAYDIPFYLAGSFFIVAALISFMVPFVRRFSPEKPTLCPPPMFAPILEDIPEAAESHNNSDDLEKYDALESCL